MNDGLALFILYLLGLSVCYFSFNLIWAYICESVIKSKGYLKGGFLWGLFFGFLGLIICLCKPNYKNQQMVADYMDQQTKILDHLSNHESKTDNKTGFENNIEQIREYKKLLDDGVITEEDFEKKKKKILNI